jgi:hypothetical protein
MSARPNTFIVGQPKSGTSALYAFLKDHPEVCVGATKEPQYFNTDLNSQYFHLARLERNESNYLKLFAHCASQKVIMEASTAYLYSRVAARAIHAFDPAARIIMVLREPVDFLFTYHMQLQRNSCTFETEPDFLKAMALEAERRQGRQIPGNCFDASFLYYRARAAYTEQVRRFLEVFPREQVLILLHDEFKADNEKVYDQVVAFLGLDSSWRPQFRVVNQKVGVRFRALKQASDQFLFPIKQAIKPLMPGGFYKAGRSLYRKLFFRTRGLPVLSPQDRQRLKAEFRDEVAALSALLDRDLLTLWGYERR